MLNILFHGIGMLRKHLNVFLLVVDGGMEVSIEHFDQFLSEVSLAVVADLVLEVFYEKLLF